MPLRVSVTPLVLDHLLVEQACREGVELRTGFWVRQPLLDGQRVCVCLDSRPTTVTLCVPGW
jgi:flavin-dependent dehydrogenase